MLHAVFYRPIKKYPSLNTRKAIHLPPLRIFYMSINVRVRDMLNQVKINILFISNKFGSTAQGPQGFMFLIVENCNCSFETTGHGAAEGGAPDRRTRPKTLARVRLRYILVIPQ